MNDLPCPCSGPPYCSPKRPTWIKLNAGQLGFYRVQYSEDGWRLLAEAARWASGSDHVRLSTKRWCSGLGIVPSAPPSRPLKALLSDPHRRSNATASGGGPLLAGTDLAGLLEDSFSLAEAGQGNITRFLNLLL